MNFQSAERWACPSSPPSPQAGTHGHSHHLPAPPAPPRRGGPAARGPRLGAPLGRRPRHHRPDRLKIRRGGSGFLSSYTNYYTVNGAVLVPHFGDPGADAAAASILAAAYPSRNVVQLNIDDIASGGGGIHCATQSQPAVPPAV
ncbi:agmatine deiminase family protein [Streptomyces sp. NPDC007863]|uniref:agmatine deiminase family protein n=1 Tax=Streptomyces sp. NPDC007863 TaxID=3154894 RepID=UPI00340920E0